MRCARSELLGAIASTLVQATAVTGPEGQPSTEHLPRYLKTEPGPWTPLLVVNRSALLVVNRPSLAALTRPVWPGRPVAVEEAEVVAAALMGRRRKWPIREKVQGE